MGFAADSHTSPAIVCDRTGPMHLDLWPAAGLTLGAVAAVLAAAALVSAAPASCAGVSLTADAIELPVLSSTA